jgi:hypothetical protein
MIMTKKGLAVALPIGLLLAFFAPGCYNGTLIDVGATLEITRDVTYTADVVPILEKNCSLSGCHSAGGIEPDLSADKAYGSLTNGGYIEVANPANSRLYGLLSGRLAPTMPVGGKDPEIAAIILAWINQGAQNN